VIEQFTDDAIKYKESVVFRVQTTPSQPLNPKFQYVMELTTINGNGLPEGLEWPKVAGRYIVEIYVDGNPTIGNPNGGITDRRNTWNVDVYGSKWKTLKFTSYITMEAERNLFIV
jgi:hypothetical protein